MTDQHAPFGADDIDEQIDLSMQTLRAAPPEEAPAPDLRLIADLQHFYPADDQSAARSLARVRQRLLDSAPSVSQRGRQAGSSGRLRPLAERREQMRFPYSLVRAGQRLSYRIATIAAAVLLVVIIGGLVAGLVLVHHGNSNTGHSSHLQTAATGTPAPNASNVYIASTAGLFKIDAKTHKILWSFASPSSYIVVTGGVVYSTAQGGEITALDAASGKTLWQSAVLAGDVGLIRFNLANGVIYAGSEADGYLYALDASNGKALWHASVVPASVANDMPYFPDVQLVNGVVYGSFELIGGGSGPVYTYLFAANAQDGSLRWETPGPADQLFNGPVFVDGVLYITSSEISHHSASEAQDSYAYAYDPTNGKLLWQSQKTNGFVMASPTVSDGGVYFGAQTDALYAVKTTDGSPLWSYQTGESFYAAPQVAGDVVYAGETGAMPGDTFIVALNAASGTVLWKHALASYDGMSQFAVGDGVLYVTAQDGLRDSASNLYALSLKDGSLLWQVTYATGISTGQGDNVTLAP